MNLIGGQPNGPRTSRRPSLAVLLPLFLAVALLLGSPWLPAGAFALSSRSSHPLLGTLSTYSNWAGYAAGAGAPNPAAFSSVSASWTQPAVPSSGATDSYADFWVGLDGSQSTSVEQIGTESYSQGGHVGYDAWYETYPMPLVPIPWSPKAGDSLSASVTQTSAGTFVLSLTDVTSGQSFTTTPLVVNAGGASAEVIAEAPYEKGVLPLAPFGIVRFTDCRFDGAPLAAFDWSLIDMISADGRVEALATPLGSDGASFSVLTDFSAPITTVSAAANHWHDGSVTLHFAARDEVGGSGLAYTEYSTDRGLTWTEGSSLTIAAPADHSGDGLQTILYRSADKDGNIETANSCWVGIDTQAPTPIANWQASVLRGHVARLAYEINDPRPGSPTADVTIRVKSLSGRLCQTIALPRQPVDVRLEAHFLCRLARGEYRFFISATDAAGNVQTQVAVNALFVL